MSVEIGERGRPSLAYTALSASFARRVAADRAVAAMDAAWGQAAVGVAAGAASLGRRTTDGAARGTRKGRLILVLIHAFHW